MKERIFDLEVFRKEGVCTTVEGKTVKLINSQSHNVIRCLLINMWDNDGTREVIFNLDGQYLCEASEFNRWGYNLNRFKPKSPNYDLTTEEVVRKLSINDMSLSITFGIEKNDNTSIFRLCDIISGDYNLDLDVVLSNGKKLQRGIVWNLRQKQELIKSVLKGIYIPNITCVRLANLRTFETRNTTYQIIDGKQRITTMMSFAKGKFPINHNGYDYFFDDLTYAAQRRILGYYFTGTMYFSYADDCASKLEDSDYIAIFEYVNFTGTPQDAKHIENLKTK